MTAVYTIRPKVYRGEAGFSITGNRARVWTGTRESAERYRDILRAEAGGHITADEAWELETGVLCHAPKVGGHSHDEGTCAFGVGPCQHTDPRPGAECPH